jgi:hypothetical protein
VIEQAVATSSPRPSERMHQYEFTGERLAAFPASGPKASELHAAVQAVTVETNTERPLLIRPGFLERGQVRQLP